jgi:alpha-L-fucosidase
LPDEAYQRLEEIGRWMKINGEAIYGTRAIAPYRQDKVCYTSKKDGSLYGIYLADEGETLPPTLLLKGIRAAAKSKVSLLGVKGQCKWRQTDEGLLVNIPAAARKNPALVYAWAIKIDK